MSFRITVRVDDSDFRQYMTDIMRAIPEFTEKVKTQLGPEAEEIYRGQIPVSEPRPGRPIVGRGRDSVMRVDFPDGFIVTATAYHLKYPAYGVRPHIIAARGEKLYFWWERMGTWFRGRQVMHPGQKKNPFHARATRLIQLRARELVQRLVEEMVRR